MKLSVIVAALLLISPSAGAGELKLGRPLTLKEPMTVDQLMAQPGQYTGKTVQVKGKVSAVCQMAGCWMQLVGAAGTKAVRIKVRDGEIVFPKEAAGKMALGEGKLVKLELTKEQAIARARHDAEEAGREFDPASIKGPETVYQIEGTGVVILE